MKQAVNKRFKDYFDKNPLSEDEKDILNCLKQDIYKILDAKDLNTAKELRNELINKNIQKQVHKQNSLEIHHSLLQKINDTPGKHEHPINKQ